MVIDEQKNRRMHRQHKHNALSSAPGDLGPETLGRINQTSSRPLRPMLHDEGAGRVNNMISNKDITPWDHIPFCAVWLCCLLSTASLAFSRFLSPLEVCRMARFRWEVALQRWWCAGVLTHRRLYSPQLQRLFSSHASTPASHPHPSRYRTPNGEWPHTANKQPAYQAKMFLHIAHSLLKLAWKWIKRSVVIPLNNQVSHFLCSINRCLPSIDEKEGMAHGIHCHCAPQCRHPIGWRFRPIPAAATRFAPGCSGGPWRGRWASLSSKGRILYRN